MVKVGGRQRADVVVDAVVATTKHEEKVDFRPPRSRGIAPPDHHPKPHAKSSCGRDWHLTYSIPTLLMAFIGVLPGFPHQNKKAISKIPHRAPQEPPPTPHRLNALAKSSCRDSHRLKFPPRPFLRYSQRYQPCAQHQLPHSQNHALRKEG